MGGPEVRDGRGPGPGLRVYSYWAVLSMTRIRVRVPAAASPNASATERVPPFPSPTQESESTRTRSHRVRVGHWQPSPQPEPARSCTCQAATGSASAVHCGNGFLDTLLKFDSIGPNRRHCAMPVASWCGGTSTSSRALLLVVATCQGSSVTVEARARGPATGLLCPIDLLVFDSEGRY
jgi:hypothetical protein